MLACWFIIAAFGVQLGFHINVGTEFVPNTRLDPLIERLALAFDERRSRAARDRERAFSINLWSCFSY